MSSPPVVSLTATSSTQLESSRAVVPAVGIDLGTTNSCISVMHNDQIVVITNEQGHRTTPSYVSFKGSERLVGHAAKRQQATNSANTIFDSKRLIGRNFSDPTVQADMKNWPFTVIDKDGRPTVQVQFNGSATSYVPEQISAMILARLKEVAETFLRHKVTDAVITVPAHFNDAQRLATMSQ